MKHIVSSILVFLFITFYAFGQEMPVTRLKDMDGKTISSETFKNDGKPIVVNFWATWCKPCIQELNAINELYDDWKKETGVRVIAVSIDDARNAQKIPPFVTGRGWEFDVYLDENSEFRRALNITNCPHTILFDGSQKIVWQHNSYLPGDENNLYDKIKSVAKK